MSNLKNDTTTDAVTVRSLEHPGDVFARAYRAAISEQIRIVNFPLVRTILDIAP